MCIDKLSLLVKELYAKVRGGQEGVGKRKGGRKGVRGRGKEKGGQEGVEEAGERKRVVPRQSETSDVCVPSASTLILSPTDPPTPRPQDSIAEMCAEKILFEMWLAESRVKAGSSLSTKFIGNILNSTLMWIARSEQMLVRENAIIPRSQPRSKTPKKAKAAKAAEAGKAVVSQATDSKPPDATVEGKAAETALMGEEKKVADVPAGPTAGLVGKVLPPTLKPIGDSAQLLDASSTATRVAGGAHLPPLNSPSRKGELAPVKSRGTPEPSASSSEGPVVNAPPAIAASKNDAGLSKLSSSASELHKLEVPLTGNQLTSSGAGQLTSSFGSTAMIAAHLAAKARLKRAETLAKQAKGEEAKEETVVETDGTVVAKAKKVSRGGGGGGGGGGAVVTSSGHTLMRTQVRARP